jgi:hypothetical protein
MCYFSFGFIWVGFLSFYCVYVTPVCSGISFYFVYHAGVFFSVYCSIRSAIIFIVKYVT